MPINRRTSPVRGDVHHLSRPGAFLTNINPMSGSLQTLGHMRSAHPLRSSAMYQRILVPFDGSVTSGRGLDEAIKLAELCGASLRILHVVNELGTISGLESCAAYSAEVISLLHEGGLEILANGKARVAAAGVAVDTRLVENFSMRLSDVVAEEALVWKADVIVIGTHGRRGVRRMVLGSDAEAILRTSPVPVLLVRAPEGEPDTPSP
jgi:nucleotide-binding universal stress UspA family protein